jgi:antitoxin component YwqK of YwqJK toxin-antitoxin module
MQVNMKNNLPILFSASIVLLLLKIISPQLSVSNSYGVQFWNFLTLDNGPCIVNKLKHVDSKNLNFVTLPGETSLYTGENICKFEGGKIKVRGYFKDGSRHGAWVQWGKNGMKKYAVNYENGRLHGKYASWHDNGKKMQLGDYSNAELVGTMTYYNKEGILTAQWLLSDGSFKHYYENGMPYGSTDNQNSCIIFDKNGQDKISGKDCLDQYSPPDKGDLLPF